MRRSTDFSAAVKHGNRAVQPDIVLHARCGDASTADPRVGLIVARSVGSAVERHRVSRRLRHVAYSVLTDLQPGEHLVIRARPGSRHARSARLQQQLRTGLRRLHETKDPNR